MSRDILAVAVRSGIAALAVVPPDGLPFVRRLALRAPSRAMRIDAVVRGARALARDYGIEQVVAEPALMNELAPELPATTVRPAQAVELALGTRATLRMLLARALDEHPDLERYLPRLRTGEVALCSRRVRVTGVALLLGLAAQRADRDALSIPNP